MRVLGSMSPNLTRGLPRSCQLSPGVGKEGGVMFPLAGVPGKLSPHSYLSEESTVSLLPSPSLPQASFGTPIPTSTEEVPSQWRL